MGRARSSGGVSNEERDNTVNQLLAEMDGFEAEQQGIVVMAATNRQAIVPAHCVLPGLQKVGETSVRSVSREGSLC